MQLRTVNKPASIRPLGTVAVDPLRVLVARLSDQAWHKEDARKENAFFCFHHTRHLVFRFTPGNEDPRVVDVSPSWAMFQPVLLPIMEQAIRPYGFVEPAFPKAMLARLEAGQEIDRHIDGAGSNLVTHKIHVPLQTNPGALFYVNDEAFHLEAGQAYEVNNIVPHGAVNRGDADRIHFIFEVFEAHGIPTLAETA